MFKRVDEETIEAYALKWVEAYPYTTLADAKKYLNKPLTMHSPEIEIGTTLIKYREFLDVFDDLTIEKSILLKIDKENKNIKIVYPSPTNTPTFESSCVGPTELLKAALNEDAKGSYIAIHNHVYETQATSSQPDKNCARLLSCLLALTGGELLDSCVITPHDYYSEIQNDKDFFKTKDRGEVDFESPTIRAMIKRIKSANR